MMRKYTGKTWIETQNQECVLVGQRGTHLKIVEGVGCEEVKNQRSLTTSCDVYKK